MFDKEDSAQAKKERTHWGKRKGWTNQRRRRESIVQKLTLLSSTSHFAAAVSEVRASQPCTEAMKKVGFADTPKAALAPFMGDAQVHGRGVYVIVQMTTKTG